MEKQENTSKVWEFTRVQNILQGFVFQYVDFFFWEIWKYKKIAPKEKLQF